MTDQTIKAGQSLHESWTIEFTRMKFDSPIVCRLIGWPNATSYMTRGEGKTVDEARLQMVSMLARAIHEDPNPFGDLGNVAHVGQVVKFLEALRDSGDDFSSVNGLPTHPGEYYLPHQLPEEGRELPTGWESVIGHVIDMVKSWADYYPEEHEESDLDSADVLPPR